MRKFLGSIVVLAALLFIGAYAGSPWYALYQLKQAAEARDRDKLEALVDFPAVRANLKSQVDSEITKAARAAGNLGWGPAAALGKLGASFGDRKIKKLVTPENLQRLLSGEHVPGVGGGEGGGGRLTPHLSYMTLDHVRVTLEQQNGGVLPLALIMERRGVFGWKVVKVELPGEKR